METTKKSLLNVADGGMTPEKLQDALIAVNKLDEMPTEMFGIFKEIIFSCDSVLIIAIKSYLLGKHMAAQEDNRPSYSYNAERLSSQEVVQ